MVQILDIVSTLDGVGRRLEELNRNQFRIVSLSPVRPEEGHGEQAWAVLSEPMPSETPSPSTCVLTDPVAEGPKAISIKDVYELVRAIFNQVGFDQLMREIILRIDEVASKAAGDKRQRYLDELAVNLTYALETYRRRHENEED